MVIRGALHLKRQMVPGVSVEQTWHAGRDPARILAVPHVPRVSGIDAAFVSEDESHAIEELVDIELDRLGWAEVAREEIHVIREGVKRRHQSSITVEGALRRKWTDQMVVPQRVGIRRRSPDVELGG